MGQPHQQSNSKPVSQMTIIERCAYCHKLMVTSAMNDDRDNFKRLRSEFERWLKSDSKLLSHLLDIAIYKLFGLICGKKSTSWMVGELVMNIVKRSIPIPSPDVGGIPYSRARTKSISMNIASSSPLSFNLT